MSCLYRAFRAVTRKRTQSILLLLLLLVVATLTLSGTAIQGATQTAQLNVRQALGGVFTLQQNTSDPDQWVSTEVGQYGSSAYYGGAPLTVELAESIQSKVTGIAGYNATYTSYTVPTHKDGEVLELIESETDGSDTGSLLAGYGDFNATVSTYASTNTAYDSYFKGGYLALTQGRHVTEKEERAVLISEALAQRNGLQVGDQMTLRMSSFKASMMGYRAEDTCVNVTIVGLFRATAKSTTSLSNWSMDNAVFTTLEVVRAARPDIGAESYEKIAFYVKDPGQLEQVVEEVKNLPEVDPAAFVVHVDNSNVEAVMEPLSNMNRLVSVLIVLVLLVGAVILYLVLSSRIRGRMHESGVLLALGLSKWNIAAQYLAEILLIALIAFPLSAVTSHFVAQTVGSQLLDYTLSDQAQGTASPETSTAKDGIYLGTSDDFAPQFAGNQGLTKIAVSLSPRAIGTMYGGGTAIICGTVLIAALPVFQRKPREIVSQMS